jgi:hypothetical protein
MRPCASSAPQSWNGADRIRGRQSIDPAFNTSPGLPSPSSVRRIVQAVEPLEYDRIYGAWWGKVVPDDAKTVVACSAERYVKAISG